MDVLLRRSSNLVTNVFLVYFIKRHFFSEKIEEKKVYVRCKFQLVVDHFRMLRNDCISL